jgi:hypothetical protein
MKQLIGTYKTENATKYIEQLCKHFAHKVSADFDGVSGRAVLPVGETTLAATSDMLTVTIDLLEGTPVEHGKSIIDLHLVRFAHREGFEEMAWSI